MNKEVIGKYLAIFGLMLFWAPLWGVIDSYLIMSSSFQEITLFGANEPKTSQEEMSAAALSTVIGILLFLFAICLLTFTVVGLNYRAKWFFWALIVHSMLLLLLFPLGTVLGIIVLAALVMGRKRFGLRGNVT
ncbi:hypothetical protein MHM93_10920 [Pseudoalteromonas sp. MM17-2]|uniref:hypothetical protein n=1 Tax=Pseudoalteromonas sp. MM17-2 TaxID=2917753 RepID=UPI001EF3FA77|nr:hypothetical protein [Pseudoalteromonas sp. MM17-2]MCG7544692.1 hypothetical protein [Pseudoalteromonas sp. MM17-2]